MVVSPPGATTTHRICKSPAFRVERNIWDQYHATYILFHQTTLNLLTIRSLGYQRYLDNLPPPNRSLSGNCWKSALSMHPLMVLSHLFLCLPFLRFPNTALVPCKTVYMSGQMLWKCALPSELSFLESSKGPGAPVFVYIDNIWRGLCTGDVLQLCNSISFQRLGFFSGDSVARDHGLNVRIGRTGIMTIIINLHLYREA